MLREIQCFSCKHLHRWKKDAVCCDAFTNPVETDWNVLPTAIPHEIIDGTFDHAKPYPGDNGIQYEPGVIPMRETADSITQTEYDVLNRAAIELLKTGMTTRRCPRCGKPLIYEQKVSWEIVRCEDETCIRSIGRGI